MKYVHVPATAVVVPVVVVVFVFAAAAVVDGRNIIMQSVYGRGHLTVATQAARQHLKLAIVA